MMYTINLNVLLCMRNYPTPTNQYLEIAKTINMVIYILCLDLRMRRFAEKTICR